LPQDGIASKNADVSACLSSIFAAGFHFPETASLRYIPVSDTHLPIDEPPLIKLIVPATCLRFVEPVRQA
jgi:hypothetical protein